MWVCLVSKCRGSGQVGSTCLKISRVGSGRVASRETSRVGSGLEKPRGSGRVASRGFKILLIGSVARSGQDVLKSRG